MSTVPAEAAVIAYRRDLWSCVCCGTLVASRPHSALRRSPDAGDLAANLLTFLGDGRRPNDPFDHRARVDSGRDPMDKAMGYAVPAGQDPAFVPVTIFDRHADPVTVLLTEAGAYLPVRQEGIEAA